MRTYLKDKVKAKGLGHGLNGRVLAQQTRGPEFKVRSWGKKKKQKNSKDLKHGSSSN
jgi:hypothetical protein